MSTRVATPPGASVRVRSAGRTWIVTVSSISALRILVSQSVGADPILTALVRVEKWRPPRPGWLGSPGCSAVASLRVEPSTTGIEVELRLKEERDPALVLASILRMITPHATGTAQPLLTWVPPVNTEGRIVEMLTDVSTIPADEHLRRTDVALVADHESSVDADRNVLVSGDRWSGRTVFLDPAVHRPVGRRSDSVGEIVQARDLQLPESLATPDVRALRAVSAVIDDSSLSDRHRAQIRACGVLVESVNEFPAADDYLAWQKASVQSRTEVLRDFSPHPAVMDWPTVSVVIATHRPERLAHALAQATAQNYPYLQIVVAVHSDEVVDVRGAVGDWSGDWVAVGVPAHLTLGQVLHEASMRAEGDLITKMDDDDFYSPHHVWDLVLARMYSGAQVVGKALDYIYLAERDVTVFRPTYGAEKYADFVAGGTLMISSGDLAEVGGWRPVPKSVDRALLDSVLRAGGLVYRTHGVGYTYVRHAGQVGGQIDGQSVNTSLVSDEHFLTKTVARHDGLLHWGIPGHG